MNQLTIGSCVPLNDKYSPPDLRPSPKKEMPKSLQTRMVEWLIGLTEEVRVLKERVKELESNK